MITDNESDDELIEAAVAMTNEKPHNLSSKNGGMLKSFLFGLVVGILGTLLLPDLFSPDKSAPAPWQNSGQDKDSVYVSTDELDSIFVKGKFEGVELGLDYAKWVLDATTLEEVEAARILLASFLDQPYRPDQ